MVQILLNSKNLACVLHDKVITCQLNASEDTWNLVTILEHPTGIPTTEETVIQCSTFSPCGDFFAVCYNKTLVVYETSGWKQFCCGLTERKGNSVQFFPKSKTLLVADKSGVVTFFTFERDSLKKLELVIGHNSMLTKALITDDERFVVTCDRDEKIRVSNYPNTYNIESYCLGHEQFICDMAFLPSDKNILVSASGDGTLRFWDFITGKQLLIFSKKTDKSDKTVKTEPLVGVECLKKSDDSSLITVQEYKSCQIIILNVVGCLNSGLKVEIFKTIELGVIPWNLVFWNHKLLCLIPDEKSPLKAWHVEDDSLSDSNYDNGISKCLKANWELIKEESGKMEDSIPVLYKREIDNVQEYHQKKKARLLKNSCKS